MSQRSKISQIFLFSSLSLVALSGAQVHAQTAQSDASDGANQNSGVGEIVVTAQKRSEKLEAVPIAIASVSGNTLSQAGVSSAGQLQQLVPSLRIDFSGAFAQPTIRGIGTAVAGNGASANVATYIDGFYVPSTLANDFQLLSVTNVSVLKGPQGTLFGRNATGGAIMVTTRDPSSTPTVEGNLSYARFNHLTASGYVSAPLSDKVALDVAGIYERGDGYVRNIVYNDSNWLAFKRYVIRSKLLLRPDEDTKITFGYQHTYNNDPTAQSGVLYNGIGAATVIPGVLTTSKPRESTESFHPIFHLNVDNFTMKIERDLGFANITSYTQYRKQNSLQGADEDKSSASLFDYQFTYRDKSFNQEIDLTSKDGGRLQWVIGANYFYDNDAQTDFLGSSGGAPFAPIYRARQRTYATAAFADATYEIVDHLFLTAGLRYNHEVKKGEYTFQGAGGVDIFNSGVATKAFNNLTPRAVARYEISPRTNVYASWSRGFKSGLFNVGGQNVTNPVNPEKVDAFEVGFKTASSTLRFSTSAYYYKYKDLQLASYVASSTFLKNAAEARIYGADADLVWAPIEGLQLRASAAYTNAKFTKFPDAPFDVQCLDVTACGAGYGFLLTGITTDAKGKSLARTPEFTGSVGIAYDMPIADGHLGLNADLYLTSKIYFDPANQYVQNGYATLNLRAVYHFAGDHFSIGAFGTNVTNRNFYTEILPQPPLAVAAVFGEPASYGVTVGFKY